MNKKKFKKIAFLFFFCFCIQTGFQIITFTFIQSPTHSPTQLPTNSPTHSPTIAKTLRPTPKDNRVRLSFIHIPKTAGTSFYNSFKRKFKFKESSPGFDELSLPYYETQNATNLFTFFRDPSRHVYSQYLECKWDHWGLRVTNNTKFPRRHAENEKTGYMPDFFDWLRHFNRTSITKSHFHCYHPLNMQVRYLQSHKKIPHNVDVDALYFTNQTKEQIKKLKFFGLTEAYTLTTCILEYMLLNNTVPKHCDCTFGNPTQPKFLEQKKITHGVPPHPFEVLNNVTKHLIQDLTKQDALLYDYAKILFWKRVKTIENKSGIIFCR